MPLPDLPEPADLHARFAAHNTVDWGDHLLSVAEIARRYGADATGKSLRLLDQAVAVEPRVTAKILAAMPSSGSAYKLGSRIKSPESLARKFRDLEDKTRERPIEDLLRYTVLTGSPDDLIAATRHTVGQLRQSNWDVDYAMHSYTEGSRYKGIHAYLVTPGDDRVELQFHSADSMRVKEATTGWYEVERSAEATPEERTAARQKCVALSSTLAHPRDIHKLTQLGGRRVMVNNYSDSRERGAPAVQQTTQNDGRRVTRPNPTITKNDGMNR